MIWLTFVYVYVAREPTIRAALPPKSGHDGLHLFMCQVFASAPMVISSHAV